METKERIMPDKAVTLIDLDDIIRMRAGKKAKYIPGFLINGLKRLIHQDFINEYLRQGYVGVDFCEHTLAYLDVKVKVDGLENISDLSRKYTFVSNHPLGAIDGVTLGMVLGRHYDGKIKYLVNDLLMNLKGLAPLCIPINKLGKQARNFPQMVENTFRSDDQVIMFPAGICSRRMKDGSICFLPNQHGGRKTEAFPDEAECREIAEQKLRLPTVFSQKWSIDRTIHELEKQCLPYVENWQNSHWLKGQLVLFLDEEMNGELMGFQLHYSFENGLEYWKAAE